MDMLTHLTDAIRHEMPLHSSFLDTALAGLTAAERTAFEEYLAGAATDAGGIARLAESYCVMVRDLFALQIEFAQTGRYRHSRLAEVRAQVYDNPDYMTHYMRGIAVSTFLWPNHLAILRFFDRCLPRDRPGAYLEVGPGHGYYFVKALRECAFEHFTAVDISPTSLAITAEICDRMAPDRAGRVTYAQCDLLDHSLPAGQFDAIVMGEVLEHVEVPEQFLRQLHALARPDGFVFVTTCCNAPAVDHIYLFDTPEEVEAMMAAAGFEIVDRMIAPHVGKTLEACTREKLAVNVAYQLRPLGQAA